MSLHDDIQQAVRGVIADNEHVDLLSPTFIAFRVVEAFGGQSEPHLQWLAVEQAKQMARRVLGAKFDVDGEENSAHQGDMFSGLLQDRYPIPRSRGEDPVYKPRHALTLAELDWNIDQLNKSADARMRHAAALQSFRDQQHQRAA
jgi:hypothetical protein